MKVNNGTGSIEPSDLIIGSRPSPEAVRKQLNRILSSPDFRSSPRSQQFLHFIVEETLSGRGSRLKAYTIGVKVLSREADFDPSIDPIVRIQAGRVRRSLEHYYLTLGVADEIHIEIPKGTYQPIFSFSHSNRWVYEDDRKIPLETKTDAPLENELSIAVIPFAHFDNLPLISAFADGLSEELVMSFTHFRDFRVVPKPATLAFRNQDLDVREVRRQFGVRFVLSGSVRLLNHNVKVTTVLHDAITAEAIWSESYLRQFTANNLVQMQREITERVTCILADQYGVILRAMIRQTHNRPAHDLSVYEAVFHYRQIKKMSREDSLQACQALEQAVKHSPNHAFAHAFLAGLYVNDYIHVFGLVDKPLDRSLDLACRAIALDSECQEAEKVLATTYLYRGEMEQFLAHTERCLSLNPSASYYIGCAGLNLAIAGDWERALDLVDKAMQLNPDYPAYLHFVPFFNHFRKGEYEQALLHARQISPPSFYWAPGCRAAALGKLKREIEGRITLVELLTLRPDFPEHARELVSHLVFDQDIINSVLDGLYRAGLEQPVM